MVGLRICFCENVSVLFNNPTCIIGCSNVGSPVSLEYTHYKKQNKNINQ